jgi:hypothetical protein
MKHLKNISLTFLAIVCSGLFNLSIAQKHEQVLIANGGHAFALNNMIRVGAYDPSTKKYANFDSFPGNSVTEFLLDYNNAFLATDAGIVKYGLDNNNTRLAKTTDGSIRRIASYGVYILATVNDYFTKTHLKVFKKSDLSLVKSSSFPVAAEGVTVVGDTAYLALEGSYPYKGDTGKIGIYDLKHMALVRTILLDTATKGISKLYNDGRYVIGVTEYPYSRITKYDIQTGRFTISDPGSFLFGTFGLRNNLLYSNFGDGIGTFNTSTGAITHSLVPYVNYAGAAYDTVSKGYYYTSLSYSSNGKGYRTDNSGKVTDSFDIGVSPEAVAIDYHTLSGIDETAITEINFGLFPNPSHDFLNIILPKDEKLKVSIFDMAGRELMEIPAAKGLMSISLENLERGMYIVRVQGNQSTGTRKFMKE